ncbi:hypothetical protein CRYUN_Cryun15aG0056100 [Craigia yunnanensis]
MNILRGIWSMEVAPWIYDVGVNQYGIFFKTEEIMERMLEEGPWSIMGNCLTLMKRLEGVSTEEIEFKEIPFWIQVHNLPIDLLTIRNAEVMGRKTGNLVKVDEKWIIKSLGRGFLKIRVALKIHDALIDGLWLPNGERGTRWIKMEYEKLSDYCFARGRLGHILKNCGEEAKMAAVD